ncbi:selT-like protein [Coffea eugenioides]|uniref:selT-like protein n=1 Tax=Coffea eugenioides TaxID=49369 RepID=UPI000F60A3FB|nr:selT-like protein [Coffea eugenioides]
MMDRTQLLLVGLPLFLLCSDLFNLFAPPPPKPAHHDHHHNHHHNYQPSKTQSTIQQPSPDFTNHAASGAGAIGFGNTVNIDFCASCSYRGTAVTMKNMLETQFPGINVVLANYPPPLPKRVLSKLVPVVQIGVMSIVLAGEHIFPRLGYAVPPPWYYSLRANRFGTISSTWLLGNFLQSFLQSSGAFEVYCNGEMVFSKLKESRFPGEIELKDLVARRIASSRVVDGLGGANWSS